ncbi:MAG TPA: carboxypeptidase-like regulatory domain-containing protein, partial [Candidatus Elarobacter sp.]|nr:carboxypeptidase-like regulatory domain-containing protein [Candidatus Elarobacter sp.]
AARADELVVGAVRDQDGALVTGAAVTAIDARGRVLARDRSAPDGTFALTSATRPVAVLIVAPNAQPLRAAVPADGSPIAAIVYRYRAGDLSPSPADVAALPAGELSAVGEIVPYRVAFPDSISDRWLDNGRGVVTVEGLPFYRRSDGGDTTSLLPAHSFGALTVTDPMQGLWYGDRGGGGVVDARLFDRTDDERLTDRDAAFSFGRNPVGLVATSWDADGERRLVAVSGNDDLGPVHATVIALLGDGPQMHYGGLGLELHGATQRTDLAARLDFTRTSSSIVTTLEDFGSVFDAVFDATGRGPDAIAVRLRWRDEYGELDGVDSQHRDAALVLGTTRGNVVRVTTAVAFAYGADLAYQQASGSGFAILPSLNANAPLGGNWSLHAGFAESTLGTPSIVLARGTLGEAALSYADRRRLRADVIAYAEGDREPNALNRGIGVALGWEIAPRVSVRAWSLSDIDAVDVSAPAAPGAAFGTVVATQRFDRNLVWLTWDAATRIDLLIRGGALEGNLRIPLSGPYAITVGSYLRPNGTRTLSAGIVRH